MSTGFVIRRATREDLPALGRLGALLLRIHYEFDRERFMAPVSHVDEGYARFLGSQLQRDDVAVFVAEREPGNVVAYVYVGLEPQSWKELREASGFVHDIVVDPSARGSGVAALLLEKAFEWLRSRGAPRVMLWTAEPNVLAQRLFTKAGFRRTMVEMTKEL
jgi:ribosomal protein S18 acetylase RimI-like enzyme